MTYSLDQDYAQALNRYQAGDFAEAERLCRDLLLRAPDHGGGLYLRAAIAQRLGHIQSSAGPERRYDKRLAIIVPYRDRAQNLQTFLPHISAYFERDKLDSRIAVSIHIVEQAGQAPFNGGMLKNCGFMVARGQADYVCFHDVDYLPVWADYAWSPRPARLIWHGLRRRENYQDFFGAVVLFDKSVFEGINGYPNTYWGWGYEDAELADRCHAFGGFERRDGTYTSLPHAQRGLTDAGYLTEEGQRTHAHWLSRRDDVRRAMAEDGLHSLNFKLVRRSSLTLKGRNAPPITHYLVDIGTPDGPSAS